MPVLALVVLLVSLAFGSPAVPTLVTQETYNAKTVDAFLSGHALPPTLGALFNKRDKKLIAAIPWSAPVYLFRTGRLLTKASILATPTTALVFTRKTDGTYLAALSPLAFKREKRQIAMTLTTTLADGLKRQCPNSADVAAALKTAFAGKVNTARLGKGSYVAVSYTQKSLYGTPAGDVAIDAALITSGRQTYYTFYNPSDKSYYDDRGEPMLRDNGIFVGTPTAGRITSGFSSSRYHPILKRNRPHLGVDFAGRINTPVRSVASGRITNIGFDMGGFGYFIEVSHAGGFKTLYGHLNKFAKGMKRGMAVKEGEHIGYLGNSGLSTGPHLHFGLYRNGKAIDPAQMRRYAKHVISTRQKVLLTRRAVAVKNTLTALGRISKPPREASQTPLRQINIIERKIL